jgi:group I intron endonuclease
MQLYKISFPPELTSKVYIGISSKSAVDRFKEHCSSKKQYPIVQALKKYGAKNAILEVLNNFNCFDEMYAAEQAAISAYGSKTPNGYNLTDGGKGTFGLAASEERKKKISAANRGRIVSDEQRKKISDHNKSRDLSAQVAAMAASNRGKKLSPDRVEKMRAIWVGRKHSDESKRKMSESASKRKASDETKLAMSRSIKMAKGGKVFRFLSPDGQMVEVFHMKEFCQKNGLTTVQMYNVASGKAVTHKGWRGVPA